MSPMQCHFCVQLEFEQLSTNILKYSQQSRHSIHPKRHKVEFKSEVLWTVLTTKYIACATKHRGQTLYAFPQKRKE